MFNNAPLPVLAFFYIYEVIIMKELKILICAM